MKITLTANTGPDQAQIPYFAQVEIFTLTIDFGTIFEIPVYAAQVEGKTVYDVEISGFRLQSEDIGDVPAFIQRLLLGLVNRMRLPSYVFIARHAGGIYPVYTVGSEVFATTPGGPVFRHVELAKVREYLSDYLHEMGVLGTPGLNDKLHVRGVHQKSLGLMRPIFYLKKRVPDQTEFWAPVFVSEARGSLYTFAANNKREVFFAGGREILNLHLIVSEVLITDNRLQSPYDLRPDRLFPDHWEQLKASLTPQNETVTVNGATLPVYRNGHYYLALERRADEDRYGLFLGADLADLRQRVERIFARRNRSGWQWPSPAGSIAGFQ